jgi:hypothetical protein
MKTPLVAACGAMMMALGACAGRAPQPVAVVQAQDHYSDCLAIAAEVRGNNQKVQELGSEEGAKVGQNVAAGVAGLFIWPLWFAMDFRGRQAKLLRFRLDKSYLGTLASKAWGSCARNSKGVEPAPVALYAPQLVPTGIPS